MAARTLLVVLLFLGTGLAGCISGDDPTDDGPVVTSNDSDVPTTMPDGRSGKLVAFEETNKTEAGVGGVDHHHDMWAGRTRVVIFEGPAMMRPMSATEATDYQAAGTVYLPENTYVFEGTAAVEFTISAPKRHVCEGEVTLGGFYVCTDTTDEVFGAPEVPAVEDPAPPTGLKLRYKHASTINWIEAGELTWGTPLVLQVTHATQTDMPHVTSSSWEFQVTSPNKQDGTLTFTAKAEIVRGEGEIPLWPGHPEFYAESNSRRVLDTTGTACDGTACALVQDSGGIPAQKLISYGTRTLYVWINITKVNAPNPVLAPDVWFLWHWNSSGRDNITNVFDKQGHGLDKKEHAWVLPVDDNGMDSPYADGSKWRFMLGGAFFKEGLSCYGGCADWSADYSLVVIATNQVLPLEEYDMYCLRDDYCPEPEAGGGEERRRERRAA